MFPAGSRAGGEKGWGGQQLWGRGCREGEKPHPDCLQCWVNERAQWGADSACSEEGES